MTFALYYYAPLGAGDRVSYLVVRWAGRWCVVGLLWLVWQHRRLVAVALAAVIVVVSGSWRGCSALAIWVTAGERRRTHLRRRCQLTDPSCSTVYLGPAPIQRENVAAYLDQSNV